MALGADGSVLVATTYSVKRISADGRVSPVMRHLGAWCGDLSDASAAHAFAPFGSGVASAPDGTIYLSDKSCSRMVRRSANGRLARVDGEGTRTTWGALRIAADGSVYAVDQNSSRIYRFSPNGTQSLIAGTGRQGYSGDGGKATEAELNYPNDIALTADGTIYVADTNNYRIRKISKEGVISTFAGSGEFGFSQDGEVATKARLTQVSALALNASGDIVFSDSGTGRIRLVSSSGIILTIAGNGRQESAGDGNPALQTSFQSVAGLLYLPDGSLLVSERSSNAIRRIDPNGLVFRFAGLPDDAGDGGPAPFAQIVDPFGIAFDRAGNGYIYEGARSRIRKVDPSGRIQTLFDFSGREGISTSCFAPAEDGSIFVCQRSAVMRLKTDGTLEVFAGSLTQKGFAGDGGAAVEARLRRPHFVAIGPDGRVHISDSEQNVIRTVGLDGVIRTTVGSGTVGFGGDGGMATQAALREPTGIAVDPGGTLYFSDSGNNRIRRVTPDGIISTVAGNGRVEPIVDGKSGTETGLLRPEFLAIDTRGNLYLEEYRPMILKLSRGLQITRVAGNDVAFGPSGDGGDARSALLQARMLAVDPAGSLYVADEINNVIRRIEGLSPFTATPSALVMTTVLGAPPQSQEISIASSDGDPRDFVVESSAAWLTISPGSGSVKDAQRVLIRVTALPIAKSGYYQATLTIRERTTGETTTVPVALLVSSSPQQMKLGQTGLTFAASSQTDATPPPSRVLPVLNTGIGRMDWTAAATTLSGGNWLTLTGASGSSTAGQAAPNITVSARQAGLAPGAYFGLVTVRSTQADNSPQSAVVVLDVSAPGGSGSPVASPQGLLFTVAEGDTNAAAGQVIQLTNGTDRPSGFQATIRYPNNRGSWLRINSTAGTIGAGMTIDLTAAAFAGDLAAGVFTATLDIRFSPSNVTQAVSILFVVTPPGGAGVANKPDSKQLTATCRPSKIVPLFRSPGGNFSVSAGWPLAIEMIAVDDCGTPVNTGRAVVTSASGDAPVALSAVGNGRWAGTWSSNNAKANKLTLSARFELGNPALVGEAKLDGNVRENAEQPIVQRDGVRNLASPAPETLVGSASLMLVLGSKMAKEERTVETGSWPVELIDTRAFIAGRPVPLRQVSDGRLEAIVPSGTPENTRHQLVVQRGRTYSPPEEVLIVGPIPAPLSIDGSGRNQGLIYVQESDGSLRLADSARPAVAGDTVILMATGLGATSPVVAAGERAPLNPPAAVAGKTSVSVEGQDAEVYYAIAEPTQVGQYRIAFKMPEGVPSLAAAKVIVRLDSIESSPVTMAAGELNP